MLSPSEAFLMLSMYVKIDKFSGKLEIYLLKIVTGDKFFFLSFLRRQTAKGDDNRITDSAGRG